jgi:hypothetical protein
MQPVTSPGTWPETQRFDYMVRTRKLDELERARYERLKLKLPKYERTALLFALRELTGKDLGKTYQDWSPLLTPVQEPPTPLVTPVEELPTRPLATPVPRELPRLLTPIQKDQRPNDERQQRN